MDHDQVFLALGEPVCKKTIEFEGRPVEVWLFPPAGRDPCVSPDLRVYFENGVVTGWQDFKTAPHGAVVPTVKRGDNPYATEPY
jgi:outer membrane protein assembly factor BamE